MYRVLGALRRSATSRQFSKGTTLEGFCDSSRRSEEAVLQNGAGHYLNYATSTSIRPNYPPHDHMNKDLENEKYGSPDKNSKRQDEIPRPIGRKTSAAQKRKFLIDTLFALKESKESVYGTLDSYVAFELNFPLALFKQSLIVLEKHEQWHKIIQVIKWMLNKGQGTTIGTYEQLIRALEKDNRAEEAHNIWEAKINNDLHSVPWRFCELMISIYYRNNMLDRLIKLFRGLESYDRKPPKKSIVRKVADSYQMLGLSEEKDKVLAKYKYLFDDSSNEKKWTSKKTKKALKNKENNEKDDMNQNKLEDSNDIVVDPSHSIDEIKAAS